MALKNTLIKLHLISWSESLQPRNYSLPPASIDFTVILVFSKYRRSPASTPQVVLHQTNAPCSPSLDMQFLSWYSIICWPYQRDKTRPQCHYHQVNRRCVQPAPPLSLMRPQVRTFHTRLLPKAVCFLTTHSSSFSPLPPVSSGQMPNSIYLFSR